MTTPALARLLARLYANKSELLMVLDRPEIPLHTNGSENDIRCHVTRRKLSGGTREQLFLAVRMAAVRQLAQQGIELPMVFDDVLVNFDQLRTEAAALGLAIGTYVDRLLDAREHPEQAVRACLGVLRLAGGSISSLHARRPDYPRTRCRSLLQAGSRACARVREGFGHGRFP